MRVNRWNKINSAQISKSIIDCKIYFKPYWMSPPCEESVNKFTVFVLQHRNWDICNVTLNNGTKWNIFVILKCWLIPYHLGYLISSRTIEASLENASKSITRIHSSRSTAKPYVFMWNTLVHHFQKWYSHQPLISQQVDPSTNTSLYHNLRTLSTIQNRTMFRNLFHEISMSSYWIKRTSSWLIIRILT